MRKAGLLIFTILVAACVKPPVEQDTAFRLAAAIQEVDTRYPVLWSEGDAIRVNGSVSEPLDGGSAGGREASFRFLQKPATAVSYMVSYPSAEEGRLSFLSRQEYVENGLCRGAVPVAGVSASIDKGVTLRSCASILRLPFTGEVTLSGLDVSTPGGEKISGDFLLDYRAGISPSSGARSSFEYTVGNGLKLSSQGKAVMLSIPLGSYSKGLEIVAKAADGTSMIIGIFTAGINLSSPVLYEFPALPYSAGKEVAFSSGAWVEADGAAGTEGFQAEDGVMAVSIKAGTCNIWSPEARKSVMDADESVSEQRSWANSYKALADMIKWLDCDVMGLQENSSRSYHTTITSPRADFDGNVHTLNEEIPEYSWIIYNGSNTTYDSLFPNNTTANGLSNTDAIIYKSSVLTRVASGRYWITGNKTSAGAPSDGYGYNRVAVWAKFTHKASGKQFVFISTHLDLPNAGPESDPFLPQRRNIEELIGSIAPQVCPRDIPSVIVGDMNVDNGDAGGNYNRLVGGRWKDVYEIMLADGSLDNTYVRFRGTMNAAKNEEGGYSNWRPDHILIDGFTPSYYKVGRETFATADGSLHWPSDHFPLKVILNF